VAYDNNALSTPQYAIIELLRANVPSVQNRVYPSGDREDAKMPRITTDELTPTEIRTGIGERFGTGMGLFYVYTFRINIWDKEPVQIRQVADEVMNAIWKHRGYVPNSPRNADGEFLLLEINGGSGTTPNGSRGMYQRTINVTGRWLSKSTETW
jgi:hypothetical protein